MSSLPEPQIVFFSPLPVDRPLQSGSAVRPRRMLEAFESLGLPVFLVDGDSTQRRDRWRALFEQGVPDTLGVYAELSTMPLALADPDHLPRAPFMDISQFAKLRRLGIPVTAFYRDIYWRFPEYDTNLPLHKRLVAKAFYHLEAWQLARHADHVFLPSLRMKQHVPYIRSVSAVSGLPPGGPVMDRDTSTADDGPLQLFYVGGVSGRHYDIAPMVRAVEATQGVRLTLCCRKDEWMTVRDTLGTFHHVEVVHESGPQLAQYFRDADVFLMWRSMDEYLRFAMPVKLSEAIGWGLPVITNADCEMGDLVEREKLGWTPATEEELAALLARLVDQRREVAAARANAIEARERHSWRARAETVLTVLARHRKAA